MELELPTAASGQEDIDLETPRLTINVKSDGTLWLAGRPINKSQLETKFSEARAKDGEDVEVRIRGSRTVPYSTVEPIMLACTGARIWNVTYAVYREEKR